MHLRVYRVAVTAGSGLVDLHLHCVVDRISSVLRWVCMHGCDDAMQVKIDQAASCAAAATRVDASSTSAASVYSC